MTETQITNDTTKLWDLIKGTRFGMLTHRHEDGLHSHPLTTQNKTLDADGRALLLRSEGRRDRTPPGS